VQHLEPLARETRAACQGYLDGLGPQVGLPPVSQVDPGNPASKEMP
jgi:hypothetical protein